MGVPANRFVNFSGVTFTPSGGSAVVITEVQNIGYDPKAKLIQASGDADLYDTAVALVSIAPEITIESQNLIALQSLVPGTHGTLTYILHDFYNGTGTGAITRTITGCVVGSPTQDSKHRQAATGRLVLQAFSADGITSPVAESIAA